MLDRLQHERGFALIELLAAMLIIGMLAAIAIPSFLTQREKSQDTCAKSQLRTMQTTMETVYTEAGSYAGVDMNRLHTAETAVVPTGACGGGTMATIGMLSGAACDSSVPTAARAYCISQTSASGRNFVLVNNDGALTRICNPAGGACRGGVW